MSGAIATIAAEDHRMIRKILVPVDGSEHATRAVDWASDIAAKYEVGLILLHVVTEERLAAFPEDIRALKRWERLEINDWDLARSLAQHLIEAAETRARGHGVKRVEALVVEGNPAKVIVAEAVRLGADLIVMGRRGLGNLPAFVLGSVSSKVLHLADCACLTVK